MNIYEIIKEAFSQGWNAYHECATDFDFESALNSCLMELNPKEDIICPECNNDGGVHGSGGFQRCSKGCDIP